MSFYIHRSLQNAQSVSAKLQFGDTKRDVRDFDRKTLRRMFVTTMGNSFLFSLPGSEESEPPASYRSALARFLQQLPRLKLESRMARKINSHRQGWAVEDRIGPRFLRKVVFIKSHLSTPRGILNLLQGTRHPTSQTLNPEPNIGA